MQKGQLFKCHLCRKSFTTNVLLVQHCKCASHRRKEEDEAREQEDRRQIPSRQPFRKEESDSTKKLEKKETEETIFRAPKKSRRKEKEQVREDYGAGDGEGEASASWGRRQVQSQQEELLIDQDLLTMEHNVQRFGA